MIPDRWGSPFRTTAARTTSLLLAPLVCVTFAACRAQVRSTAAPGSAHPGEQWYEVRAEKLGMSIDAARARDRALPEDRPPKEALDDQTRAEAEALWSGLCAGCHGLDGDLTGVAVSEPAPRKFGSFGMTMGFTMGGDKMRAGIYRKIRDGGQPVDGRPSLMPAFGGQLSREQIWALVAYIEDL